jgi:hypothetical protein
LKQQQQDHPDLYTTIDWRAAHAESLPLDANVIVVQK